MAYSRVSRCPYPTVSGWAIARLSDIDRGTSELTLKYFGSGEEGGWHAAELPLLPHL